MALNRARCINPAGVTAWKKLAERYSSMGKRVESAATTAAERHVAQPARRFGAHPATGVFSDESQVFVGVPHGHPDFDSAFSTEFGDDERIPGAQIRSSVWTGRNEAVRTFHEGLTG